MEPESFNAYSRGQCVGADEPKVTIHIRYGAVKLLPYRYGTVIFGDTIIDGYVKDLVRDLNATCDRCHAAEERVFELECQIQECNSARSASI